MKNFKGVFEVYHMVKYNIISIKESNFYNFQVMIALIIMLTGLPT